MWTMQSRGLARGEDAFIASGKPVGPSAQAKRYTEHGDSANLLD